MNAQTHCCAASLAGRLLTVSISLHMAPDGGVEPHGIIAAHGVQDRCQRRLTSSGSLYGTGLWIRTTMNGVGDRDTTIV